jgi:hypothetical protein
MKKFELDLSVYSVEIDAAVKDEETGQVRLEKKTVVYPFRSNLSAWLRTMGIFKTANDIAEAVSLARAIRNCQDDKLVLDDLEARILKTAVDKLVEITAEGKGNLGGEMHEEAICRVAKMKEVE